ncbi:MAG: hypothetical protein Q9219_007453 [cf. Caloplaca sp. 3 TL-2023]
MPDRVTIGQSVNSQVLWKPVQPRGAAHVQLGALKPAVESMETMEFGSWTILVFSSSVPVVIFSYVVYNLFFHPLRNCAGPRFWAASRVPWCWYQIQGRLQHKLLGLHIKYGHAVRVAPNEISFSNDTGWKTIYGQRSIEMQKDPTFSLLTPTGVQRRSDIQVADRETHIRQRRLLSHAFSEKALREQEGILQAHVSKLLRQFSRTCNTGAVDLVAWFNFLNTAFDLIGDMAFGEDFGCLNRGDYAPFVRAIQVMAVELTYSQMWKYWGLMGLRKYFMSKEVAGKRVENVKRAMKAVSRRMERETDRKDFMHYILAAKDGKGMSPEEIHVNAFSLSIAGSESTATALCGVMFLLLTHPQTYDRLTTEIRSAFTSETDITIVSTNDLVYLDAVIMEALRVYPPVAITMPRRTPAGGETVDGIHVPEGMTVGVNHLSCYRHPDNFYRPDDFLPERWLAASRDVPPFHHDNRACFQPFSFGPRNCLGKNLARAEMRLALARLLFRFDLELSPGQDEWQTRQKIQGFWQKPPLYCVLTPVKPF